jgi:hypothetical protein
LLSSLFSENISVGHYILEQLGLIKIDFLKNAIKYWKHRIYFILEFALIYFHIV